MALSRTARFRTLVGAALVTGTALVPAACVGQAPTTGRKVIAVIAADGYADLKQQLAWIGPQIDNPGLAGTMESLLLLSTQGKGLAGLDVKRPIGVFVTTKDGDFGIHAALPVKDVDKLLGSLQGLTGPVEKDGDIRRMTLPSGQDVEVTEKDGWCCSTSAGRPSASPIPRRSSIRW